MAESVALQRMRRDLVNVLARRLPGGFKVALVAWTVACLCAATPVGAQEVPADRVRLEAVLVQMDGGDVPLDELMSIQTAAQSPELRVLIEDLVRTRDEVAELRTRYRDEYPPIQEGMATIRRIETVAIPDVVRDLLANPPTAGVTSGLPGSAAVGQAATEGDLRDSRSVSPGPLPRMPQCSEVLFYDGFESGGHGSPVGGRWHSVSRRGSQAISDTAYAGALSWRMTHDAAAPDVDTDVTMWATMDDGMERNEVWVTWALRIPDNYAHRIPGVGSSNNKFFIAGYSRATLHGGWRDDGWHTRLEVEPAYNDPDPTRRSMSQPYVNGQGGEGGGRQNFGNPWSSEVISAADRGKWVVYTAHIRLATSLEASDGTIEYFRNGKLIKGRVGTMPLGVRRANNPPPPIKAFEFLGWANSGYTQETTFYLDEVTVCGVRPTL